MRGGPHLLDEKVVDCKLAVPQNLTEHVPLNAGGKKIFVGGVPTQAKEQVNVLRPFISPLGACRRKCGLSEDMRK